MDLSINRLKVLGEEEIQRLDLKITEYKNSNQSSVLDKSINDIKTQISDLSSICNDLEIEVNSKNSIIGQLQNTLSEYHKKYETLNENILSIELSIQDHDKRKIELQSQFELMDETISRLRDEEQKNKDTLRQLNIKLEQRKVEFKNEKEIIENEIKNLELKMKELIQNSMVSHNEFTQELQTIKLCPIINDVQLIFDNIKFDLLTNLSRNILSYSKDDHVCFLVSSIDIKIKLSHNGKEIKMENMCKKKIKALSFWHKNILKCKSDFNRDSGSCNCGLRFHLIEHHERVSDEFIKKIMPSPLNNCLNKSYYMRDELTNAKEKYIKDSHDKYFKLLETQYKSILENIIIHPELLMLIKQLNYYDFYNLFTSYNPFNIEGFNSYQFIYFIAFIATNGFKEENMKSIEIEHKQYTEFN
jgi:hypothetical protein